VRIRSELDFIGPSLEVCAAALRRAI
jgi:hypothetical protein